MSKINNTATVTAKYSLPDGSYNNTNVTSNVSTTEYMTTSLQKQRLTTKTFAVPNAEIEQMLMLTNNAEQTVFDIYVVDTISAGATFKEGSLSIDDVPYPDYHIDGYFLPNELLAGECVIVRYVIVADAVPTVSEITSVSNITYSINEITGLSEDSNTVSVEVVDNNISITKSCDKGAVVAGQTIRFTNVIENKGSITNTNVVFRDEIPAGTSFVAGSVVVNGVAQASYDPAVGFSLGTLSPNAVATVVFDVLVVR